MIGRADTIFGIATGHGRAGIAVMRVSGGETGRLVHRIAGVLPTPRRATLRRLSAEDGPIDHALVLWFPGPNSYTGEDCAEFHLHGGPAISQAMADALLLAGARAAEPGEFTRRAFLSGRIDLVEAEGIADLIDASTPRQRRQALAQAEGETSAVIRSWAAELRHLLAMEEALIDFPEEAADAMPPAARLAAFASEIEDHLRNDAAASRVRDGLRIAVVGAPNVGKSSLLNRLSGRDVAIVSAHPGTTRDVLETTLVIAGVPATIADTAGQRDTTDEIEREGIRRAKRTAEEADIVVEVLSADEPGPARAGSSTATLRVTNKIDLGEPHPGTLGISARDGTGFAALRDALTSHVSELTRQDGAPVMTNARHRGCLEAAVRHLRAASAQPEPELRAEDLRESMRSLGRLTGVVDAEMLLDTIFSAFCIGK